MSIMVCIASTNGGNWILKKKQVRLLPHSEFLRKLWFIPLFLTIHHQHSPLKGPVLQRFKSANLHRLQCSYANLQHDLFPYFLFLWVYEAPRNAGNTLPWLIIHHLSTLHCLFHLLVFKYSKPFLIYPRFSFYLPFLSHQQLPLSSCYPYSNFPDQISSLVLQVFQMLNTKKNQINFLISKKLDFYKPNFSALLKCCYSSIQVPSVKQRLSQS